MQIGDTIPDLVVATTQNEALALPSLKGQKVVIYFYPKDNTPGCTKQGQALSERYDEIQALNAVVLGVSRESVRSHNNFINKFGFAFDLISDPDETLCKVFDVIKEKSMYGKTYLGIERSTFVFDEQGLLRAEQRKVKVPQHADWLIETLKSL